MKKLLFIICFSLFANLLLTAQTQTQNLNMGLYQLQFPSANGGSNRIQSYGGSFPGTWEFKSRFDDIHIDAGENSSNNYDILFKTGGSERARVHANGNFGIGMSNPLSKLQVEGRASVGQTGVLALDWTYETNWAGSSSKWAGYIGFNAYRNNNDNKDKYFGKNRYTSKGAFEGSNYGFRWLFRNHNGFDSDGQHLLSEYMRLDNNGNLGIGSTRPISKLHIEDSNASGEVGITIKNSNAALGTKSVIDFITTTSSTKYGSLAVENTALGAGAMTFSTRGGGDFEKMRITSSGKVGIGTTNPNSPLAIGYNNGANQLAFKRLDGNETFSMNISSSNQILFKNHSGGGNYDFQTNIGGYGVTSTLFIKGANGNVGIGTITPDSKLTVAGKIHAQEVKVTIDAGADFVFNEGYKLTPLKNVEKFIKEYKHLPEIASEKEMQEKGLLLAKMNIKLLQKIEELTLYTINQEKRIEILENENNTLKTQEDRITKLEEKLISLSSTKE